MPAPVQRRLKALKKIQFESTRIEAEFYKEVHQLEIKYHKLYQPQYEARAGIIKGNPKFWLFHFIFLMMNAIVAPSDTSYEGQSNDSKFKSEK